MSANAFRKRKNLYVVVVTCAILHKNSDGKIEGLILKRSMDEKEGPGLWTIAGGKVERIDWGVPIRTKGGKHVYCSVLERAMRREIFEETGLDLKKVSLFRASNLVFIRTDGTPTIVFRFYAWCKDKSAVQIKDESTDYAWITEAELDNYTFIQNVGEDLRMIMRSCS